MPFWIIGLLVGLAFSALSVLLMPRPKKVKPEATTEQFDFPTAEAGRPLPVVFGTVKIQSLNIIYYGEKAVGEYEV